MDLSFVLPYILVSLALASECHNLDPGAFYVIFAVALAMVYSRDFFLFCFGCAVMAALVGYMTIAIPGTPLFWCLWAYIVYEIIVVADRPTKLICVMGMSTATGLCFAPCLTMVCWVVLLVFAVVLVPYTIVCCMGAVAMLIYPWLVQKNWTLRWRRLLLYGGQSYRTILLIFAWQFQARPLYTAILYRSMDYLQGRSDVAYEAAGGPYEDYARCATGRYCYQCAYSASCFAISFESLYGAQSW